MLLPFAKDLLLDTATTAIAKITTKSTAQYINVCSVWMIFKSQAILKNTEKRDVHASSLLHDDDDGKLKM